MNHLQPLRHIPRIDAVVDEQLLAAGLRLRLLLLRDGKLTPRARQRHKTLTVLCQLQSLRLRAAGHLLLPGVLVQARGKLQSLVRALRGLV